MQMFSIFNGRNDSKGKSQMADNMKDGQTVIVDIEDGNENTADGKT